MHTPVDSFSRSAALEFVRSPLLERGHLPAVNIGSVTVAVNNGVTGYYGPGADRWILHPILRVRAEVAGESRELIFSFFPWPSVQLIFAPFVFAPEPARIVVSQSAGWAALQLGAAAGPFEVSRNATTSVVRYTTLAGDAIVTRTIEGEPFDVRAYRDLFWNSCITTQDTWPQAPQAANPVLFYQITLAGALSVGVVLPGSFQPQSRIQMANLDLQPAGFDIMSEAFRVMMGLKFAKRRNAFNPVGEAVNGAFSDFDFDGISIPLDCFRGITSPIEDVIPPRIPQATLDTLDIGAVFPTFQIATADRRLIPPDAAHPLITC